MATNPFTRARSHRFDVLTVGAATRDVFIQSKKFKSVKNPHAPDGLDACFPLGAKIDLDAVTFETGGGATNAAVTFARFGMKTACAARIGKDPGGNEIITRLKRERVETSGLQSDPKLGTGYSLILVSGTGQRAILVFRGASRRLDARAIPWSRLRPEWIYLTSVAGDLKALTRIFSEVKKFHSHVAWNPGNAEIELGMKRLLPFLMQADILNVNREEAAALAEVAPRDLESILQRLGSVPRQALVVTDGRHGAYIASRGITWYAPALPGKRVNTTGAGDAFGSAFVAAAIKTGNIETGLRAGMLNAFGVITHMGAKAGILKRFPSHTDLRRVKVKKLA
ncbi:carbohydrate kinase family protein [Candidatus Uhrbacteria bacterium]|nr:carbohydrate kinase family protein [Candidatus Uhrbacteria bacterium]